MMSLGPVFLIAWFILCLPHVMLSSCAFVKGKCHRGGGKLAVDIQVVHCLSVSWSLRCDMFTLLLIRLRAQGLSTKYKVVTYIRLG